MIKQGLTLRFGSRREGFSACVPVCWIADANPGWLFRGWGGDCPGAETCLLTADDDLAITVDFAPAATLSVSKEGNGTVTSSPTGINCGSTCSVVVVKGTPFALTAAPDRGHTFRGWGGACAPAGLTTTCNLTADQDRSVTAAFTSARVELATADLRGTWRRSRLRGGSLTLAGHATLEAEVTVGLNSPGRGSATYRTAVPNGTFTRTFPLPQTGFWPGTYTLTITGSAAGVPIEAARASARLAAPREGVVSRAWITRLGSAEPTSRVSRSALGMTAHFAFVAAPAPGSTATVAWFRGRTLLATTRKRPRTNIESFLIGQGGLAPGPYTAVLSVHGKTVSSTSVTVG